MVAAWNILIRLAEVEAAARCSGATKGETMKSIPAVRSDGLVVDAGGDGVLVYDQRNDTAHSLDGAAASVWRAIDGRRSLSQIARHCDLSEAVVAEVLVRLGGIDLLLDHVPEEVSRRAALRKIAKVGGTAVLAAPLISTVVIPAATAMASSCTSPGVTCGSITYVGGGCSGTISLDLRTNCAGGPGCICSPAATCDSLGVASVRQYTCQ
jgi:hypothetical protein